MREGRKKEENQVRTLRGRSNFPYSVRTEYFKRTSGSGKPDGY